MFPDTDLPLALIMEEILGWEKKEDSDTEKEDAASQQHLSTRNKKPAEDCYIFHRLLISVVQKRPAHFIVMLIFFAALCIDFPNCSAIPYSYRLNSIPGACPRCNLYR